MSQASAVSKPPPIATPLTAAISGLSRSKRCDSPAKPVAGRGPRRPAACTFKSLPAEKARSPAPVMMPTHKLGIGGELVPYPVEFPMRLAVQRVHHLGPVDRDDAQPAFVGDRAEAVFGHATLPERNYSPRRLHKGAMDRSTFVSFVYPLRPLW